MSSKVQQNQQSLKTLSQINRLPFVSSASNTAFYYYNTFKNTHSAVRVSFNVAEYSLNVATTITSLILFYVCSNQSNIDFKISKKLLNSLINLSNT